jgi:CubicO group peptidase (beta-lactamase class C family)
MVSYPALRSPHEQEQRQRFSPVYAVLEEAVERNIFPGCTFGVLETNQAGHLDIVLLDAVGRQTYAADSPVIQADTIYDLASLTKVLATTAMAMLLHQRRQLDLDRPVADVLPGFACGQQERWLVTVRHLLAHSSGIAGYARLFESYSAADALFNACLCMPLEAAPGTRVEYSDIGFILLGRLLESITGETIDSFCRREVFDRLRMRSTCFRPSAETRALIPPTEDDRIFRHRVIQGEVQDENCWVLGGVSGHAGLFGNALDILQYSLAVLASCEGGLFEPPTIQVFTERVNQPPGSSRALGWDTPSGQSSAGVFFSSHSVGHLGYAGTSLWIDLDAGCTIVLLSNRTWPHRDNQQIRQLRPVFHDAVRKLMLPGRGHA